MTSTQSSSADGRINFLSSINDNIVFVGQVSDV